jgi:hypothetical protein
MFDGRTNLLHTRWLEEVKKYFNRKGLHNGHYQEICETGRSPCYGMTTPSMTRIQEEQKRTGNLRKNSWRWRKAMAKPKNKGLGRGLEALMGEAAIGIREKDGKGSGIEYIDINNIKPNRNQPRKVFSEEKIIELADSIKEHGVIQPLIVRAADSGYELVAGERRWRAARTAGLKEVPCILRELTEEENMLLAVVENMQREDLNPIEEAEGLET